MSDEAERDERDWEEACRREDAIRTLLTGRTSTLTAREVEAVAVELGLSRATLYRMIRRYRDGGTVSSLLPRSVGRPKKSRSLAPEREALEFRKGCLRLLLSGAIGEKGGCRDDE